MSFRLDWIRTHAFDAKARAGNRRVLSRPWRYYAALAAKFLPGIYRAPIDLVLRDGGRLRVREFMSLYIYKEIFVDRCYDVADLDGIPAPVVLDVGANIGFFALRMQSRYPAARILCFEPFPANFDALEETISLNGLDNVQAVREAVSGEPGTLDLYVHPTNIGGHSLYPHTAAEARERKVRVECTTLADVLKRHDIPVCHLLKLDCEGAEHDILMALDLALAERIRSIVFEPTPRNYSVDTLVSHLDTLGYHSSRYDGLVLCER